MTQTSNKGSFFVLIALHKRYSLFVTFPVSPNTKKFNTFIFAIFTIFIGVPKIDFLCQCTTLLSALWVLRGIKNNFTTFIFRFLQILVCNPLVKSYLVMVYFFIHKYLCLIYSLRHHNKLINERSNISNKIVETSNDFWSLLFYTHFVCHSFESIKWINYLHQFFPFKARDLFLTYFGINIL